MYQLAVTNPSLWTNRQFTAITTVIKAVIIIITTITKQLFNIITIAIMPRRPRWWLQQGSNSLHLPRQPRLAAALASVKPHEATVIRSRPALLNPEAIEGWPPRHMCPSALCRG